MTSEVKSVEKPRHLTHCNASASTPLGEGICICLRELQSSSLDELTAQAQELDLGYEWKCNDGGIFDTSGRFQRLCAGCSNCRPDISVEKQGAGPWVLYQRLGQIEAREAHPSDWPDKYDFRVISISPADWEEGFTKGGMVARNSANPLDQWYIAPAYFAKHYAVVESCAQKDAAISALQRELAEAQKEVRRLREAMIRARFHAMGICSAGNILDVALNQPAPKEKP